MRIILLLLISLTGPFCTFTQASTLVVPSELIPEPTIASETSAVIAQTEKSAPQEAASTPMPVSEATEAAALTEKVPSSSTEALVIISEPPKVTAAPTDAAKSTDAEPSEMPTVETHTDIIETTAEHEEAEKTGSESPEDVEIEEEEGMGTGQLVGIVIGALITVIVVIAVIILVVRRMGQYSTAKKQKPQKKDSILISALKMKARQEEKKKKLRTF